MPRFTALSPDEVSIHERTAREIAAEEGVSVSSVRNRRWRKANPAKWNATKKRNYDRGSHTHNGGDSWTVREMDRIVDSDKPTDRELSKELGRSVMAIQVMRCRIRKGPR